MNSFHFLFRDIAGGVLPYLPPLPRAPSASSGAGGVGEGVPISLEKSHVFAKNSETGFQKAGDSREKRLKKGGKTVENGRFEKLSS
ncbi:MAG: hypothetical protein PUF10_00385 [Bacteroidales bacterium]|nr:hypothetical protein [Bacteroidales bacterium]